MINSRSSSVFSFYELVLVLVDIKKEAAVWLTGWLYIKRKTQGTVP